MFDFLQPIAIIGQYIGASIVDVVLYVLSVYRTYNENKPYLTT